MKEPKRRKIGERERERLDEDIGKDIWSQKTTQLSYKGDRLIGANNLNWSYNVAQ